MCTVELVKSHTCRHKWVTIVKKCNRGSAGFDAGHLHHFEPARPGLFRSRYISAAAHTCPECDKKADYDASTTRIIVDNVYDRGTLGNGYTLTDGYGNPLPVYHWGGGGGGGGYGGGQGYTTTSCGMTRMSRPSPSPDYGCGCNVM
ncbi:uncharacterized protein PV06_03197 [Exophiala oligosperma]|uniref:Uncharacterized protein n=1 Tax=Exophiala oligosperma TaxID=215243 RepID=A0A0D2E9U6_9EURO|nr:uncharacterized protein PV06_03197 [Exophiala oligosperma]KIW44749.1 hypothetical protein PV06_03197 [Exophiala oligosperma]